MKKTTLQKILWPTIYMGVTIGVIVAACFTFKSYYFESVFVDGSSMEPTLKGTEGVKGGAHFGFTDNARATIKNLKRFDIVTTYYPFSSDDYDLPYVKGSKIKNTAYYKIKRIMALPGDTFKIENNDLYFKENDKWSDKIDFESLGIERKLEDYFYKDVSETTLKDDEYWVMGDNWTLGGSRDSGTLIGDEKWNGPVYRENLIGKLIAIEGECTLIKNENGENICTDKVYYKDRIYFK